VEHAVSVAGSTFFARIAHLREQVGHGEITGRLVVDQVYAHYQHEGTELRHPRGGQSHFLRDPMFETVDRHMEETARRTITPEGSELRGAMEDWTEALSTDVETHAPREFGDLERSGQPIVTDDGVEVYHREPKQRRLTEQELQAKGREGDVFGPPHVNRRRLGPKR
jgi:hypothetical protein